jgi:hypothetical protein
LNEDGIDSHEPTGADEVLGRMNEIAKLIQDGAGTFLR